MCWFRDGHGAYVGETLEAVVPEDVKAKICLSGVVSLEAMVAPGDKRVPSWVRGNLVRVFRLAAEQRMQGLFPNVYDRPSMGRAGVMTDGRSGELFGVRVQLACTAMQLQTLTSALGPEGFLPMRSAGNGIELYARCHVEKQPSSQPQPQQRQQEQPFQRVYWMRLDKLPLRVANLDMEDMGKILVSAGLQVTAVRPVMSGNMRAADSVLVAVRSPRPLQGHGTLNLSGLAPGGKVPARYSILRYPQLPPLAMLLHNPVPMGPAGMAPAAQHSADTSTTPAATPQQSYAAMASKPAVSAPAIFSYASMARTPAVVHPPSAQPAASMAMDSSTPALAATGAATVASEAPIASLATLPAAAARPTVTLPDALTAAPASTVLTPAADAALPSAAAHAPAAPMAPQPGLSLGLPAAKAAIKPTNSAPAASTPSPAGGATATVALPADTMDVDASPAAVPGEKAQPGNPGMVVPAPAATVPHAQPASHSKQLAHPLTPSPSGVLSGPAPKRPETQATRAVAAARAAADKQAAQAAAAAVQRKAARSARKSSKH